MSRKKSATYWRLEGELNRLSMTHAELAMELKISPGTISNKFTGRYPWTIPEAYYIMKLIEKPIAEIDLYFPA